MKRHTIQSQYIPLVVQLENAFNVRYANDLIRWARGWLQAKDLVDHQKLKDKVPQISVFHFLLVNKKWSVRLTNNLDIPLPLEFLDDPAHRNLEIYLCLQVRGLENNKIIFSGTIQDFKGEPETSIIQTRIWT